MDTKTARGDDREATKALLEGEDDEGVIEQRRDAGGWRVWSTPQQAGTIVKCALAAPRRTVAWHSRGDYLCTVSPDAIASMQCVASLFPGDLSPGTLKRGDKGGQIQSCVFHPSKPFLFVASRTTVRLYHLARQELVKTLRSGCKWISLSGHPSRWGPLCGRESGSAAVLARPGSGGAGPSHAQISRQSTQGGNIPS